MKYYLCRYEKIESEHASEHALDLAFNKSKMKNIYKVILPDLTLGCKIYDAHGEYGEIVKENGHLIYIKRIKDVELIDCMVVKRAKLEQLYINGVFVVGSQ